MKIFGGIEERKGREREGIFVKDGRGEEDGRKKRGGGLYLWGGCRLQ